MAFLKVEKTKLSYIFQQSQKIAVYHNMGEISPTHPPKGGDPVMTFPGMNWYSLQNFIAFARTVSKCMKNKQTDRQTFFFIYIDNIEIYCKYNIQWNDIDTK